MPDISSKSDTIVRDIEQKLRKLLESLYETTSLYSFEEILSQYSDIVNGHTDMLFYIRERARFDSVSKVLIDDGYLVFEYMSFEIKDGKIYRFIGNLKELRERAENLLALGYHRNSSNLSCLISDINSPFFKESIVNLTKRIFTAFYKNCGGNDHFISNVVNRYSREYFDTCNEIKIDELIGYIEKSTGLTTVIGEKTYSGPLEEYKDINDLIKLRHSDSFKPNELFSNKKFVNDLKTALSRKIQTFGKIEELDLFYVIKVFSDGLAIRATDLDQAPYRMKERALAIYTSRSARIRLDDVHCANHLILSALTAKRDKEREHIFWQMDRQGFGVEETLLRNPVPTTNEILSHACSVVNRLFLYALEANSLERIIFRAYIKSADSSPDALVAVAQWPPPVSGEEIEQLDQPIFINDSKHLSVQSFLSGKFISFESIFALQAAADDLERRLGGMSESSEQGVQSSVSQRSAGSAAQRNPRKTSEFLGDKLTNIRNNLRDREELIVTPQNTGSSVASCPIVVGRTVFGTVDFIGSDDRRLAEDRAFFSQLGYTLAEKIRRIQLANDQGWLRRMSFIHAARHRIESILRRAGEHIGDSMQTELAEIFSRETRALRKIDARPDKPFTLRSILDGHPGVEFSDDEIAFVDSEIGEFLEQSEFSDFYEEVIEDVFDTLFSNRAHGPVSGENIVVHYHREVERDDLLEIGYGGADSYVPTEELKMVGVSPIRDQKSLTYHYGLFLLGVQVRMAGGIIRTLPPDPSFSQSRFGLSILLGG